MQKEANSRPRIGLVGSGMIGGNLALLLLQQRLGDVILYDVVDGLPQGKALDISNLAGTLGLDGKVTGTNSLSDLEGASVIIITAGIARKPGMSRDDLVGINGGIIKTVANGVKEFCPNAFVICITNPLDVMVGLFQRESGLPHNRVVGMAGVLDSGRFAGFIADELKVSSHDVRAMVVGGHGDSMVPLPRFSSIAGVALTELVKSGVLSQEKLNSIIDRTRNCGAEIVGLLKNGSAFYAPAAGAVEMAEAVLRDRRRILPCAVYLNGEYGHKDVYAGVPVVLGRNGVEKIIELALNAEEKAAFDESVEAVKVLCKECKL